MTFWHPGLVRMRQVHIHMTPFADEKAPWELQYIFDYPLLSTYQKATLNNAKTPLLSSTVSTETR
jgi:hypothetical protein